MKTPEEHETRKKFIAALLLKRQISPDTVQHLTQLTQMEIKLLLKELQLSNR
ncbi:hypothetical protein GKZ89_13485 [Bacillus mangrovi]|uniref:Uncharacterized protein n=1 Tax=Metabacillus mangrovi TaxID=1491830 RepID=A0A7X2S6J1_9BACI|nr:hypothetical protein [Metabacillus mangrovi]MTH54410.1 hypothetical protein [Metabacillus mangrovi]